MFKLPVLLDIYGGWEDLTFISDRPLLSLVNGFFTRIIERNCCVPSRKFAFSDSICGYGPITACKSD